MSEAAPKDDFVIRTERLARWYGPVIGLTDLTMDVPPGVTGLLGPNGAGKSTLMRLMSGLIKPSRGSLRVLGCDPRTEPRLFERVGFCSEDDALIEDMTVREMVTFLARCSGIPRSRARERADGAIERVGLSDSANRRTRTLSKGMRQRTRLAACIVHEPELILLDEPMTGLDPVGRRDVLKLIRESGQNGCSVLFSSHILHEVEAVAEHVVLINRGMVLAEGSIAHIKESMSDYRFTLRVTCDRPRDLAVRLVLLDHVDRVQFEPDGSLLVGSASSKTLLLELPGILLDLDLKVEMIDCPGENLESLFERLLS